MTDLGALRTPGFRDSCQAAHTAGQQEYEESLAQLVALLHPGAQWPRLVTLVGRTGCGKTQMAADAVRRLAPVYGGAVYSVSLAQVAEPVHLPFSMLGVLQAPPGFDRQTLVDSGLALPGVLCRSRAVGPRSSEPFTRWLEQVAQALPAQPCLFLLDHFEQLLLDGHAPFSSDALTLPDGAAIVGTLLALAPQLRFLVTSRRLLDLDGEYRVPLFQPPLRSPLDATPRSMYTRFYG